MTPQPTEAAKGPYTAAQIPNVGFWMVVDGNGLRVTTTALTEPEARRTESWLNAAWLAGRASASDTQSAGSSKGLNGDAIVIASRRIAEEHRKHNRLPDWPVIAATKALNELSELGYFPTESELRATLTKLIEGK